MFQIGRYKYKNQGFNKGEIVDEQPKRGRIGYFKKYTNKIIKQFESMLQEIQ